MTTPIGTTEMLAAADDPRAAMQAMGGVQLAGYTLQQRLGAGGYGEVWRAIGPGGLPKAVKMLYGERDGQHAEAELKALERMRDLRHPFLLSIERIEVVNSRLIVVTELADGNLSDRFQECRRNSLPGIPRDELLGYLRDVADALDFMAEQHGLQHLDIKPDNILLQGSHAKVGDFGLAKDISVTNVSVLNGFTPMYAAPELFEGRPGRASDQYSLAIVYQMALTGNPPFNGRTAAQLTAQHLRSQPDLTGLQPIDRPVIARALAKNMNSRFDNCRQFVDELGRRRHARTSVIPAVAVAANTEVPKTALVKTQFTQQNATDVREESTPIAVRPVDTTGRKLSPSAFIGVGGLGGSVLKAVRNLVRIPGSESCPLSLLQIDTDRESLSLVKQSTDELGLSMQQTCSIPLKSSSEYRKSPSLDLSWLSRRWLFNIPRSGKVEGIRPLGRLALCAHRETVERQIEQTLRDAASVEGRQRLEGNCEIPLSDDGLDVYVVASTCGGTGSGTAADIGLMVRESAARLGIRNVRIHGILLHMTTSTRNASEVQEANTVSALKEIQHLLTPGLGTPRGFSGKPGASELSPFDQTNLIHLGDGLNDGALRRRVQQVSDLLSAAVVSGIQLDRQEWADSDAGEVDLTAKLHVLGLDSGDATTLETVSHEASHLTATLLNHWAGKVAAEDSSVSSAVPPELAETRMLLSEMMLTDDALPQQIMTLLRGSMGQDIEAISTQIVNNLQQVHDLSAVPGLTILDLVTEQLSSPPGSGQSSIYGIISELQKKLNAIRNSCVTELRRHVLEQLDQPHRLHGAVAANQCVIEEITRAEDDCRKLLTRIDAPLQQMCSGLDVVQPLPTLDAAVDLGRQYGILIAWQTIHQCFVKHVQSLLKSAQETGNHLRQLQGKVAEAAARLTAGSEPGDPIPQPIVDAFDRFVRSKAGQCLQKFAAAPQAPLGQQIAELASQFLTSSSGAAPAAARPHSKSQFPQAAWPVLRNVGGKRRVLGLIPQDGSLEQWRETVQREFGNCVVVRAVPTARLLVACDLSDIPVETVIQKLTSGNPHIADVASRVHTRIDISW
ncbi:MAG: tubulin-like doman-containing protein [Planctomycetaceae bacterium]